MAKGDMEIFTFMALDKRPLDLEMECKRRRRLEHTKGVLASN
jgi:hypothetical protein